MTCTKCGKQITTTKGCAYETVGWVIPRTQGGTNHLLERKTTGRMMCPSCTTELRYGVTPSQLTIDA